jgi:hypothetical protein
MCDMASPIPSSPRRPPPFACGEVAMLPKLRWCKSNVYMARPSSKPGPGLGSSALCQSNHGELRWAFEIACSAREPGMTLHCYGLGLCRRECRSHGAGCYGLYDRKRCKPPETVHNLKPTLARYKYDHLHNQHERHPWELRTAAPMSASPCAACHDQPTHAPKQPSQLQGEGAQQAH